MLHRTVTVAAEVHLDDQSASPTISFLDILSRADLVQLMNGLTHHAGHTLDVFIARTNTEVSVVVDPPIFSDRSLVTSDVPLRSQ